MRLAMLGATAERLLDLGAKDQAVVLLREGEKIAHELPLTAFGGYARGAFAEELGQIDLPAALGLMKDLKDVSEFDRHHGNLAQELAAKDPTEAERLLGMLHNEQEAMRIASGHDWWGVSVCYRMAPVDLPRARRIAERMTEPRLKARAYAVMAQAIARQEPKPARELIASAFDALQALVDAREVAAPSGGPEPATQDRYYAGTSASSAAAALLPSVEAVDPALVPEYFWRAISFRLPAVGDEARSTAASSNAALAMTLARYNREVAAAVLKQGVVRGGTRDPGLAALALIDPAQAVTKVETRLDPEGADWVTRTQLATLLSVDGEELWRKLNDYLTLWSIDVEDI